MDNSRDGREVSIALDEKFLNPKNSLGVKLR
jgi:hypothetical protein